MLGRTCISKISKMTIIALFFSLFALFVCAVEYDENGHVIIILGPTVEEATESFEMADDFLNTAYDLMIETETLVYGEDAKKELIDAQLAWIKYRDLETTSTAKNPFGRNKLTGPIIAKTDLTQERAVRLKNRLVKLHDVLDEEQCINKRHDPRTDRLEEMIVELNRMEYRIKRRNE